VSAGRLIAAAAVVVTVLGVGAVPARAATGPTVGPDRVVLQTDAGDVVLEFYPQAAPRTVAHVLALARSGVLDGSDFFRVVPGFVAQLDTLQRATPLTPAQQAVESQTVPLEWQPGLHHQRGVLSMAHDDGKPDDGGRSFSIVLGNAPNLDGQYTIFGDVAQGMDVVDEIASVALNGSRPVVPVTVQHAIVTDAAGVAAMQLRGPIPLGGSAADISSWPRLILSTSMGDVLVVLSPRDAPAHVKLLEQLVDSGAYNGSSLGRVDPQSYVQWFAPDATTTSSVLPAERGTVGNVAGALTVDSRDAERVPALTFLLTDNHTLDGRYTAVGWVTEGSDVLNAITHVPTGSDHRPRRAITLEKATIVTGGAPIVLRGLPSQSTGTHVPTAVFGLMAGATAMGLAIFLLAKRLPPAVIASLALLVVLLGFFALWVGLVPRTAISSQWLGVGLFAGAIAVFRLMGRFEKGRPLPDASPAPVPAASAEAGTAVAAPPADGTPLAPAAPEHPPADPDGAATPTTAAGIAAALAPPAASPGPDGAPPAASPGPDGAPPPASPGPDGASPAEPAPDGAGEGQAAEPSVIA